MVSTNSTHAQEAKTAFGVAIEQATLAIAETDELEFRLRGETCDLLANAIQVVLPTIKYIDAEFYVDGPVCDVDGMLVVSTPDRGALVANLDTGSIRGKFYLLRDGQIVSVPEGAPIDSSRVFKPYDLLRVSHLHSTDEIFDLVMAIVEGLTAIFNNALKKNEQRRQSLQIRLESLQNAAQAFAPKPA